jgi:hypothetical protein
VSAIGQRCEFAANYSVVTKHFVHILWQKELCTCDIVLRTVEQNVTVLQEVYTAGGSATYGRVNTNSMFDAHQTRALTDNYIRQQHSAHFVGAVRRTDLHGCTAGFNCRSFLCCAYSRFKLTSYNIYI